MISEIPTIPNAGFIKKQAEIDATKKLRALLYDAEFALLLTKYKRAQGDGDFEADALREHLIRSMLPESDYLLIQREDA